MSSSDSLPLKQQGKIQHIQKHKRKLYLHRNQPHKVRQYLGGLAEYLQNSLLGSMNMESQEYLPSHSDPNTKILGLLFGADPIIAGPPVERIE